MKEAESPQRKKVALRWLVFGLCVLLLGAGFVISSMGSSFGFANNFLNKTALLVAETAQNILGLEKKNKFAAEIDLFGGELEQAKGVASSGATTTFLYVTSVAKKKPPSKISTRKSTAIISEVLGGDSKEATSSPADHELGDTAEANPLATVSEVTINANMEGSAGKTFKVPPICDFSASSTPTHKIIFNEIAWMGSPARLGETASQAGNREWLELKSLVTDPIDLSSSQILDDSEKFHIVFSDGEKLAPGDFYLFERTSDNTLLNILANKIYFGALSNVGERLRLFNGDCELLDEIDASNGWPGGDNSTKQTLERNLFNRGWHTSAAAAGTPKAQNSNVIVDTMSPPPASEPAVAPTPSPSVAPSPEPQAAPQPLPASGSPNHAVLFAVQISGSSSTNDFVKIYNPTGAPIDISGWKLRKKTSTGSDDSVRVFASGATIQPQGYFSWANSYGGFALLIGANESSTRELAANNSIVLMDSTGNIIDAVAWGNGINQYLEGMAYPDNPNPNQILNRKFVDSMIQDTDNNSQDFEIH